MLIIVEITTLIFKDTFLLLFKQGSLFFVISIYPYLEKLRCDKFGN